MDKKTLRQQIRQLKKLYTPEQLAAQSEIIMGKMAQHPDFIQAKTVMLYASLADEVQTLAFIRRWVSKKNIILPTVVGNDIVPVAVTRDSLLTEGDFHILEPAGNTYKGSIDLIVVPGMAFDVQGHRLGRGRGYYDRFLCQYPTAKKIGICFDFQFVQAVPTESFDQIMDEVVTL